MEDGPLSDMPHTCSLHPCSTCGGCLICGDHSGCLPASGKGT